MQYEYTPTQKLEYKNLNTKTWISWELNIVFLRNKKILNLCFRWQILRSYRFVAEVTFKYEWPFSGHQALKGSWLKQQNYEAKRT